MTVNNEIVLLLTLLCLSTQSNAEDIPCAAQQIPGKSVVCVCNTTYCDTITRVQPARDSYVVYTSSQGGLRFKKNIGKLQPGTHLVSEPCPGPVFTLNPDIQYQAVEGFGASVTDAVGILWAGIPEPLQKHLIDSCYSGKGLEYNMIRVPIGGTDFSTHTYAYNEYPPYDSHLTNFTLAFEDYQYKIPMIKAIMKVSPSPVHIIATTWSPPVWMKTSNDYISYSRLLPEYYQTYADYHLRFIENYDAEGIPIWGITTSNEPTDGMIGINFINCLGWNVDSMATWIIHNLGPTIRHSRFKDVKIICGDDQRPNLSYWVMLMFKDHPEVLEYIDGVAVHFYLDNVVPPTILTRIAEQYPDKFIINTEAAAGSIVGPPVDLGQWQRAKEYISDIIGDINNSVTGWIDWNMCLNNDGGPNWNGNAIDSQIIIFPEKGQFVKQPTFYALGHFSKFVPRGSRRIEVTINDEAKSILNVAFVTPNDTVVVVLYNEFASSANIVLKDKHAVLQLEPNSVTTLEFPYN